jgi:hypothetical protein
MGPRASLGGFFNTFDERRAVDSGTLAHTPPRSPHLGTSTMTGAPINYSVRLLLLLRCPHQLLTATDAPPTQDLTAAFAKSHTMAELVEHFGASEVGMKARRGPSKLTCSPALLSR